MTEFSNNQAVLTRALPDAPAPESEDVGPPLTRIRPPRGWQPVNVAELWHSRELLLFLAWRDVKVRYKQTALGAAWAVLQPAMLMVVFTLFFHRMAKVEVEGPAYPVFVLAGLLPWTFFAAAVANAANSVVGSERLITKVYFPRLAIPFASVGAAAVDFAVSLALLGLLMVWYRVPPGPHLWLAPLVFVVVALAGAGAGTFLAALNVQYRDFRYVVPFLLQVGMFATPTIYMQPSEGSRGTLGLLLTLNPMTGLISTFRASFLGGDVDWPGLAAGAAACLLVFVGGCFYFRRVESRFADVI
jgi:lipopolysaccharide transport system permease protein